MKTVLLRTDGNSKIGIGHVMRCLSIADCFKESQYNCVFVMADDAAVGLVNDMGYNAEILNSQYDDLLTESKAIKVLMDRFRPEYYLIDSYYLGKDYLDYLKNINKIGKIVVIDDLRNEVLPCDALVHYAYKGENERSNYAKMYEEAGIGQPELLLGLSYAPLRAEFCNVKKKEIRKSIKDVLVLTGGSDVCRIGYNLINYLEEVEQIRDLTFHIVIGAYSKDFEYLKNRSSYNPNIILYYNQSNMSKLMRKVDFAVTAGGVSLLELMACGVPMCVYFCADNQELSAQLCNDIGIPCLGDARYKKSIIKEMFDIIEFMEKEGEKRKELSIRMQKVIDGYGARRIAKEVLEL